MFKAPLRAGYAFKHGDKEFIVVGKDPLDETCLFARRHTSPECDPEIAKQKLTTC